jgi:7,8-dihydropterin-6-yl-methyl-4-(beta-D-ribofuranosyl)aminobenzene 5'-phosphate synthase
MGMRRASIAVVSFILAFGLSWPCLPQDAQSVSLAILCDNYAHDPRFQAEWGFSCLVAGLEKTILFDAGGAEGSVRQNLATAGIDLSSIGALVFSHSHTDHIAGLPALFPLPATTAVFEPAWFASSWKRTVEAQPSAVVPVTGPTEICPGAVLTGPVFGLVTEEALCVRTASGLVVIVGCAHPGIVKMVEAVQALFPGGTIALVIGGLHLAGESAAAVRVIAQQLFDLGVVKVAPTHCSGDVARLVFGDVFGENYVDAGVGLVLTL